MSTAQSALESAVSSLVNRPAMPLSLSGPASVWALLAARRLRLGLTYADLADRTGMSERRLVLLFQTRGQKADAERWQGLGLKNFLKLCAALGVDPLIAASGRAVKSRKTPKQ